jgi:16S rRNA (cytidine1402-2'-O)-methyltransferase
MAGTLFLVTCWISEDTPPESVVPAGTLKRIHALEAFVVENAKSARAFLAAAGHPRPLRDIAMRELNEHTPDSEVGALLAPLHAGRDVGLLSEAGAPTVADPGARLVAAAHAEGIRVVPLVGPSAILLALMASGLDGQRFRFHGYLPAQSGERRVRIAQLERDSAANGETQAFIETPYRNDALLGDLLEACHAETRLAVAIDLTGPGESIRMESVREWRARRPMIGKHPAVFLLLARTRAKR